MTGEEPLDGAALDVSVIRERLREDRPHTFEQLCADTGADTDVAERLLRVADRWPDDGRFGDRDRDWLAAVVPLLAWVPADFVERNLRLRARTLRALAVSDLRSVSSSPGVQEAVAAGVDPGQLGHLVADAGADLLPRIAELVGADYLHQVLQVLDSDVVDRAAADLGRDVDLAVGFVDLVGFTKLSAAVDPDGMHDVLDAFESLVERTVTDVGDVATTKTIGDAVMLVSGEADRLAAVLLEVVTATGVDALADVARRAGMALGEVRIRDGDYVGTVVNTAARLTDAALPGSLVVTPEAWEAMDQSDWDASRLPPTRLKGLGTSRPVRLRR